MAEQTDIFVSHEREERLGPPVTNAEIARRTRDANAHFLKLDDYLENNITAIGTITQELFFVPLLVPDEETDNRYIPERGNLRLLSGYSTPAITEHLFSLTNLKEKAQQVADLLKAKGIQFVYSLKREAPDKSSYSDEISFYFAFGQNATNEVLDELTNSAPTGIYSPELHQNQLRQKKVVYMKLDGLSRYLRRDANKEEALYSPGSVFVDIPYTPDMEISNSIASLAEVFDTMQKTGLLSLPQNPTLEVRFAKETKSSVESAVEIAYTEAAYNIVVQKLKTQGQEQESSNPFVRQFSKDLKRVPFVTFREAVRMTNLNFPAIKGRDMVTRMEICEVGKTKSGDFVPLLPAGDYIPPEEDYRNHFMHSRIWETWQIGRSNLTEQLQEPKDFIKTDPTPQGYGYRGYFIELASGAKLILVDAPDAEKVEIFKTLQAEYGISNAQVELKANLDSVTYQGQVSSAIEQEAQLLAQAGIPQSDIDFYKYWSGRFYLSKDSNLQTIYENVRTRYNGLSFVVLQQRRLGILKP